MVRQKPRPQTVVWAIRSKYDLFVRAHTHLHEFVVERFDVADRRLAFALVFPSGDMAELLVVTFAFTVRILVFLAEMAAAALFTSERVAAHEFAEFEEVGHAAGAFERLVDGRQVSRDFDAGPEFLAQRGDFLERLFQAFLRASHAAALPHNIAEALVETGDRLFSIVRKEAVGDTADFVLSLLELG